MHSVIKKSAPQYKANLHCHSNISDGRLTPAELYVSRIEKSALEKLREGL